MVARQPRPALPAHQVAADVLFCWQTHLARSRTLLPLTGCLGLRRGSSRCLRRWELSWWKTAWQVRQLIHHSSLTVVQQ